MTAQHAARHRVETDLLLGLDAVIVRSVDPQKSIDGDGPLCPELSTTNSLEDLDLLHSTEADYRFHSTAYPQLVFGSGAADAKLMFVGGAPNEQDAVSGVPFAGPDGDLLANMLKPMGYSRQEVYITTLLKCLPQENQNVAPQDSEYCQRWLHRQIELVNPLVIISLGGLATSALLGTGSDIASIRGQWGGIGILDRTIPVMPTYDPAFVLQQYTKEIRGVVWSDLQQVMQKMEEVSSQI